MSGNIFKRIWKEIGKEVWSLIFRTLIIIIGAGIYIVQNTLESRFFNIDPVVLSVTFILLSFSWTQAISNALHKDEIKEEVKSINSNLQLLNSAVDVRVYDNFAECRDHINKQIEKATDVRNMCVITCSHDDFRLYTSANEPEILDVVNNFIKKGGRWHDIFSSTSKVRASLIREKIGENNLYHARVLLKDVPIMNFIILKYGLNNKEVFFGFGLHKTVVEDHIYSSKNQQMVETFERYYEAVLDREYTSRI